jgi:hypothetical protein
VIPLHTYHHTHLVTWANRSWPLGVLSPTEKAKHRPNQPKNTERHKERKWLPLEGAQTYRRAEDGSRNPHSVGFIWGDFPARMMLGGAALSVTHKFSPKVPSLVSLAA